VEEKSLLKSKTIWLNMVAFFAAFLPVVQEWLATNPVELVSVFVALNVIVRFATRGKISLFSGTGAANLFIGFLGFAALGLVSCSPSSLVFRDGLTGDAIEARYETSPPPLPYYVPEVSPCK